MAYGVSNDHVTDDVMWPKRCCEVVRSAILATAWLLVTILWCTLLLRSTSCCVLVLICYFILLYYPEIKQSIT